MIENKANAVSLVADAKNMDLSAENNLKIAIDGFANEDDDDDE